MVKFNAWISAARPRTLPLSISGIVVGSAMAYGAGAFEWAIFILALLTTLGFQILSNFANDYGDGVKGTDNAERIGPMRAMQSGLLSAGDLKKGIVFTAILTSLLSLLLIYAAFGSDNFVLSVVFFLLGLSAILAAVKYTVGRGAYGYRGMGDFFVFMFFGLVAVVGTYFMFTEDLTWTVFLPALTIGLLSVAVLNLNNMRDRLTDARVHKITIAVMLGGERVKRYHLGLLVVSLSSILIFFYVTGNFFWSGISLIVFVFPLAKHFKFVLKNDNPAFYDPQLKVVALSTFVFAVLFALGYLF